MKTRTVINFAFGSGVIGVMGFVLFTHNTVYKYYYDKNIGKKIKFI